MDPMVSARVPAGLRDQVNEGLRSIGSTPTELINRAYEFFLATGTLPGDRPAPKPGKRVLNAAQRQAFEESIRATTCNVDGSLFAETDWDDALEQALRDEYEALS
ncbi:hypothetical protein GMI69_05220 [Eggerthellaceae bacterium zg-887]|uniref:hypothetical protein n=1 Tax=Xiamenia xianingshaonis TaxID=2682776 RepID=UPI00140B3B9C|nr:hypothetical protein [Xiamenia xianingshaonis]NHM16063.1 hypothetical protein [Xiamenia xianingshaonis]